MNVPAMLPCMVAFHVGAFELNVLRIVKGDLFFVIQTPQHFIGWQGQ